MSNNYGDYIVRINSGRVNKEKLIMELQHFEGQGIDQEKQLEYQITTLEQNKDLILKLEIHYHSLE
jgi:hypothetical protein